MKKIGFVSDHGGFELKEYLKSSLSQEYEVLDYGTNNTDSVDYPTITRKACLKLLEGEVEGLVSLCGTGIGASMAANKVKGIRAALCHDEYTAEMSRRHNNANVLVLGGRILGKDLALRIVQTWIKSPFEGGRHQRRIDLLDI
ncbi:MAG: ribose 5-phosphate isomerase B [Leptospiraceae bacterium]|nr:ribose 5-phosphate isomerase B [Leptospiraceae bacterium]MCP5500736.1 ribose 5-phosphate isomerase B [Leptospiraceae bacterium]